MAVQNAGCVFAYFCGGHKIFGHTFVSLLNRQFALRQKLIQIK